MIRTKMALSALALAMGMASAVPALAQRPGYDRDYGRHWHHGYVVRDGYYAPAYAPVYDAPPPPPPVYEAPVYEPAYVAPAPVYVAPLLPSLNITIR